MLRETGANCAYCRKHFSDVFIWLNTPQCFRDEYFYYDRVSKREIERYLYGNDLICKKSKDDDRSLIWCYHCGEKFECSVLKVYFKAIFENIHMKSEHKKISFKLFCPHCKEEWSDEDMYETINDYEFLCSIHVFNHNACCICQYKYNETDLDYIDNTCEHCGAKICEDCLKNIMRGKVYRCYHCGSLIINSFDDYHICDCGEIISNS